MAKLVFENLTDSQARTLADWYEGQGEQNASDWLEEHCEDKGSVYADVGNPFWLTESVEDNELVVRLRCKTVA